MKIAIITDTHAGARQESDVFNEYFLQFFSNIFFPYLEEHKISTVIHLGDVFDRRKYINFKILESWNKEVFSRLSQYDTHIIVGNHDVYYRETNKINSVEQVLSQYNFNVYTDPCEVTIGNLPILFLPWINRTNEALSVEAIKNTTCDVAMGHLEIMGFEMFAGSVNEDHGFSKNLFEKFNLCFSGHYHHKSHQGGIHYLGSPYPMIWSDCGDQRGFHIFDTETLELIFVPNPYDIFLKIHYNDQNIDAHSFLQEDFSEAAGKYIKVIVENKTNPYLFEQFIEKLNEQKPIEVSIPAPVTELLTEDELDQTKDTLSILTEYVGDMNIDCKSEVIRVLKELYSEAFNMGSE